MSDRLRSLWNFDDLDGTEARMREQLECEATDEGRAEVLTQLARVEGLRDDFDAGERLIEAAENLAGESDAARARVDLERGRLRRSSGKTDAALPLFESAFAIALEAGECFIAGHSDAPARRARKLGSHYRCSSTPIRRSRMTRNVQRACAPSPARRRRRARAGCSRACAAASARAS